MKVSEERSWLKLLILRWLLRATGCSLASFPTNQTGIDGQRQQPQIPRASDNNRQQGGEADDDGDEG